MNPADYYIEASEQGGEPPGRWWGPGAQALGLAPGDLVEREPYDLLFGERKAPDGAPLGRPPAGGKKAADIYAALLAAEPQPTPERKRELRAQATRKARQSPLFFDLTLSLSKSISVFHASLGENARLAREAADADGERYWSALVAETDEMIMAAVHAGFGYFQREAGYTRTGSHGKRAPRDDGNGFEISGVPQEMMDLFSSRRQAITADHALRRELSRHGGTWPAPVTSPP
jgi:hypothetical protein